MKTETKEAPAKKQDKSSKHDEATKAAIAKKVAERETKYIYPKDCITSEDKKKFRHKTRNSIEAFEKKIKLIERGESDASIRETKKEYKDFLTSVLKEEE